MPGKSWFIANIIGMCTFDVVHSLGFQLFCEFFLINRCRKHGSLFSLTVPPQNENVSYNILGASTNLQKHCIAVLHSRTSFLFIHVMGIV